MLHGVVNISDITAADGRKLDQVFLVSEAFEGTRNDYVWPSKHHVSPTDYTSWRQAMEFLFPENLQLSQPLGNWIIASDTEWIDKWDWFLSGTSEFLYFRLNSRTWHRFLLLVDSCQLPLPDSDVSPDPLRMGERSREQGTFSRPDGVEDRT
jgi:hypothetical protein